MLHTEASQRFVVIGVPRWRKLVRFESPEYQAAAFRRDGGGTVEGAVVEDVEATTV